MNLDKLETGFAPLEQSLSYDLTSSGSGLGFKPTLFEPFKMPSMEDMILRGQKRAEFELYKKFWDQASGLRGFDKTKFPDPTDADPFDTSWMEGFDMPDIGTANQRLEAAIAEHDNFAGTKSDVQDQYKLMDPRLFTGRNDLTAFKKTMRNQTKLMRSMFKQDANGDDSQRLNTNERDYLKEFKRENRNAYKMAKTVAREKGVLPSSSDIKGGLSNYLINPLTYAFKGANDSLLSNKNFSSTARTANSLVDASALAAAKYGGFWGGLAALGVEAGKFGVYAGGKTSGGFDVANQSDSYGQALHHQAPQSFTALTPLLARSFNNRRNYDANMAVTAKNISDTQHLATEASSNRSQYVIDKNNIALNGGLTDNRLKLLSAKNGAKLQSLLDFKDKLHTKPVEEPTIIKAQNGAKLEQVEVSEEKSVIPEGALHKNKHDDFDLKVTPKGIPVVTVADDNVETLAEILEQKDTLVQHAEIEHNEVIFSKELTEYIEEARKKWHESDGSDKNICLEVGLRLTKELLMNTDDNTGLVEKLEMQQS